MSVEIMNLALDLLEEEPLVSPDDDRTVARWMNRNFGPTRDALLRQHPFNFAVKRAKLAAEVAGPESGWTYAYPLPADCLKVLPPTYLGELNGASIPYAVEGRRIVSNTSAPVELVYISRVEDATQFDALFTQALASALAARAANFITGKASYAQRLEELAARHMMMAQMVDAQEGTPAEPEGDDWLTGRWGA